MNAAKLNFDGIQAQLCEQGSTFIVYLTLKDSEQNIISLDNYEAKMQIRKNINSDLILELSTENGRIDFDSNFRFILHLSETETALLAPGNYLYDFKCTDNVGTVSRLIEGRFVVKAQITI